jgi:hypothetical protein
MGQIMKIKEGVINSRGVNRDHTFHTDKADCTIIVKSQGLCCPRHCELLLSAPVLFQGKMSKACSGRT